MARTQLLAVASKSAKQRQTKALKIPKSNETSASSSSSAGVAGSVVLEKKLGLVDILGTNEGFILIDWLLVIEKTVIKVLEMIQVSPKCRVDMNRMVLTLVIGRQCQGTAVDWKE